LTSKTLISSHFSRNLPQQECRRGPWRLRLFGQAFQSRHRNHQPLTAESLLERLGLPDRNTRYPPRLPDKVLAGLDGSFIVVLENLAGKGTWVFSDPLGNWRAHWAIIDRRLCLSERPAGLLPLLAKKGPIHLRQHRLAEHFAAAPVSSDGSFFSNLHAVLPGHVLRARAHPENPACVVSVAPYYRVPENPLWENIRQNAGSAHKNEEISRWAADFRQCLDDALGRYLTHANREPVALSLSGGLDSGLIAGLLAHRQDNASNPSGMTAVKRPPAHCLSYHFQDFPEADESQWTTQHNHLKTPLQAFDASALLPLDEPWPVLPDAPTSTPWRHIKSALYQHSINLGAGCLLTGVYADHLHAGWIYHGMDRWRQSRPQALREAWQNGPGLRDKLAPFAPGKWRRPVRKTASWLQPDWQQRLQQAVAWPTWHSHHPHPQQAVLTAGLYTADSVWLEDVFARQAGLRLGHPYRDRQLVEKLMQAPAWVLGNRHDPKQLARQAAAGLLPDAIVSRREGRTLVPVFVAGVLEKHRDKVRDLLNRQDASWMAFVRTERVRAVLDSPATRHRESDCVALWQCISYELWREELKRRYGTISD